MTEADGKLHQASPVTKSAPLKPIDQRPPVGTFRTLVFFIVRDILDQDLLRRSLDRLIRNHLPVLGAKIKPASKKGGLEEYIYPQPFPEDATLFSWSTSTKESTLDASELFPDVASSKGAVVWGRSIRDLEAAWTPDDWPRGRSDDGPDTPLLLVHVTDYEDATVLTVNIPHAVVDQKGLASMVEAWLLVAQGEEPPPFIELPAGALDGPADLPSSELRRKGQYRVMTKIEFIRSLQGLMVDVLRCKDEDYQLMFLSAEAVASQRVKCNEWLRQKHGEDHVELTNGDIVSSMLTKVFPNDSSALS